MSRDKIIDEYVVKYPELEVDYHIMASNFYWYGKTHHPRYRKQAILIRYELLKKIEKLKQYDTNKNKEKTN